MKQSGRRDLGGKGKTCDPNIAGQCFSEGNNYMCENVRLGGNHLDYRCVDTTTPAPTPSPEKYIKCHTNHNPTYTPECPSGYTCEAIMGSSKKHAGQCTKSSDEIYD